MNWTRVLTMILIALIVVSITVFVVIYCSYSTNRGNIEDTGFIIQELNGVGGIDYNVDDNGNIYFAVYSASANGIVVYNEMGDYKYTLPIKTVGAIAVQIDEENNISWLLG